MPGAWSACRYAASWSKSASSTGSKLADPQVCIEAAAPPRRAPSAATLAAGGTGHRQGATNAASRRRAVAHLRDHRPLSLPDRRAAQQSPPAGLFPTICDVLGGASYPESVQAPVGRGLAPVVADPEADHRRVVHAMLLEGQMARTGSSGSSMAGFGFRLRLVPHRVNVWQGLIHG